MSEKQTSDGTPAQRKTARSRGEVSASGGPCDGNDCGENGSELAQKIIDTVRESMLVLDTDLCVVSANESFYRTFQISREQTEGRSLYELGNGHWDIPELRELLDDVLPENKAFNDFEVQGRFEKIGRRVMLLNGRRVDHIQLVLLAIEDVTDHRMAERRRSFLLGLSDAFRVAEHPQRIMDEAARRLCQFLPCERAVLLETDPRRDQATVLAQSPSGRDDGVWPGRAGRLGPDLLAALTRDGQWVVDDVGKDPRFGDPEGRDHFLPLDGRALACIARRQDSGRLGLILAISTDARRWRAEELDLLGDVADRTWSARDAALATAEIERLNESLEEQVSRRTASLRLLQDVTRGSNAARTVEQAMQAALLRITEYNGWPLGHVWRLAHDDRGDMVSSGIWFTAANAKHADRLREYRQHRSRHRYAPGEGVIGDVVRSGEPKWIENVAECDDRQQLDAGGLSWQSVIALPVTVNGHVVAVMEFLSDRVARRDPGLIEIMPDIGIQLGHVIKRKRFEKAITDAAEAEQRRIGGDIHDGVGQVLAGLRYMAETHAESLARQALPDAETARRMTESLETVQRELRGVSRQLVPVEVDTEGLVDALRGLAEQISTTHDVICEFECPDPIFVGDADVGTQLYRIAQEAVRNAVRHARASRITIRLTEDAGRLGLLVADDGVGLSATNDHVGIGLRSMEHRAGLIGAAFDIRSGKQMGTRVTCTVLRASGNGGEGRLRRQMGKQA